MALPPAAASFLEEHLDPWIWMHISRRKRDLLVPTAPVAWAWEFVIVTWLLEVANFTSLLLSDPHLAQDLLTRVGVSAIAHRQRPIAQWKIGDPGVLAGIPPPGSRSLSPRGRGQVAARES